MRCAVYTRVSTEHDEQKTSLENQKDLFFRYIHEQGWDLHKIYTDVESGTVTDREQLQQMLEDAENKRFDIILAKELSRLARNVVLTYKIKDLAEKKGIHILTLDGAINTLTGNVHMLGFYAVLYEQEAQRTSERVKYALDSRAQRGLYKGGYAPYGYCAKQGKLYIRQDDTPDIIRRIFKEYLSGYGQDWIARRLWEDGIPTPSMVVNKADKSSRWHGSTIMKILQNPHYAGDLVQSRTATYSSVTNKGRKKNKKEDWIIVKDTHEAIISRQEFETVQQLIKTRSRQKPAPKSHLFTNVVFCADCGRGMHFRANRRGYVCGSYDKYGKKACSDHIVREAELEDAILKDINSIIENVNSKGFVEKAGKKALQQEKKIQRELEICNRKMEELKTTKSKALNKFVNDIITKEDYDFIVNSNNTELEKLTKKQQEYQDTLAKSNTDSFLREVKILQSEMCNIKQLTTSLLNRFIERIEIKKDGSPKIFYRFSDSFFTLLNYEQ